MEKKERIPFENAKSIRESLNAAKINELTRGGKWSLTRALEKADPSFLAEGMERGFDAFERVLLVAGLTPRSAPEFDVMASTLEDLERVFGDPKHPEDGAVTRAFITEIINRSARRVAYAAMAAQNAAKIGERSALGTTQDAVLGSFLNPYTYPASINLPKLEPAIKLSDVVAVTEGITRDYVKPFYMNDIDEDEETQNRIAEGTEVPAIEITNREGLITLKKTGVRLDFTYETLRQSPIDQVAYVFQRIEIRNDARKLDRVISTLISGDGNSGTAATNYTLSSLDPDAGGHLTLRAYLAFKKKFKNPFLLTHIFGQEDNTLDLELLDTGSANIPLVMAGGPFNQQFAPMNDRLRDSVKIGDIDSVPSNLLLGIDGRVAVKRWYQLNASVREIDVWIREQKKSFVMTENEGYQNDEPLGIKTLQLDA